jgi:hypothetical protein
MPRKVHATPAYPLASDDLPGCLRTARESSQADEKVAVCRFNRPAQIQVNVPVLPFGLRRHRARIMRIISTAKATAA